MPVPYSDNMYSSLHGDDDSDVDYAAAAGPSSSSPATSFYRPLADSSQGDHEEDPSALSPTDGYFHASPPPDAAASAAAAGYGFSGDSYYRPQHQYHNSVSSAGPTSSNVPHVPDVWVADPSLEQGSTADSKRREAEEDRLRNRGGDDVSSYYHTRADDISSPYPQASPTTGGRNAPLSSSFIYTPTHSRGHILSASNQHQPQHTTYHPGRYMPSPTTTTSHSHSNSNSHSREAPGVYSERPAVLPSEAPPAYTPSPISPPSSPQGQTPVRPNYSTFPQRDTMGRPESEQLLGNNYNDPQSMTGSPSGDNSYGTAPAWRRQPRRGLNFLRRHNCRVALLGLLLLVVTLGFLANPFTVVNDKVRTLAVLFYITVFVSHA